MATKQQPMLCACVIYEGVLLMYGILCTQHYFSVKENYNSRFIEISPSLESTAVKHVHIFKSIVYLEQE